MKISHSKIFFAAFCAALRPSAPACAQDRGGGSQSALAHDHVLAGITVLTAPAYQGADKYRTLPLPMLDIVSGPFFVNLFNGVGVNVIDTASFTFGGSVTMMPGYRRRDVPEGIDRLKFGAGGRLVATARAGGAVLRLGATRGFAGSTKGVVADASLAYPFIASPRIVVIPSISTTWANRKHNDRYFGIDSVEAAASGLPQYHLGDGFKDFTVGMTTTYRVSKNISLTATGGLTTLLSDAKESPLVEHQTQPTGTLSLLYRFGK